MSMNNSLEYYKNEEGEEESGSGMGLYVTFGLGITSMLIIMIFFYIKKKKLS